MKILGLKSSTIQEKTNLEITNKPFEPIKSKIIEPTVSQDLSIISFKNFNLKFVEEDLDAATIENLRAELNSNLVSNEKLADTMIDYVKKNSWHK